eukprot:CAMPEP_0178432564 /NCGR_PEP_ID=MMETSP0689_2-20121128/32451_1 /TAXON_ID=160604 /ORGANISM="Amphidinium massartii, Strain CS-259" /LENGTH=171 /DNA_ID=CAMNT_0020054557 /DNA_START=87 /DNA_END=598 /DNA_ORIENTATION=-
MSEVVVRPVGPSLARNLAGLFPEHPLTKDPPHVAVTLALQTKHRQSAISDDMLKEREECFAKLVERMEAFGKRMAEAGRWCDFIEPSSRQPVKSSTSTTFTEADDDYQKLGFQIMELGCCRVVASKKFGQCVVLTTAFVQASKEDIEAELGVLQEGLPNEFGSAAEQANTP